MIDIFENFPFWTFHNSFHTVIIYFFDNTKDFLTVSEFKSSLHTSPDALFFMLSSQHLQHRHSALTESKFQLHLLTWTLYIVDI